MNVEELPPIASRDFMGGVVRSVAEDGARACVCFTPPDGMTNPHGTVQGGFVAAMVDDAVSLATWFAGGQRAFVTSSLNCYYLRPVPVGVQLLVTCERVRVGQRQAVFEACVTVDGDESALVKAVQIQQFL